MAGLVPFESTSVIDNEEPKGLAPFGGTTVIEDEEEKKKTRMQIRAENNQAKNSKKETSEPPKENPFQFLDENTDLMGSDTQLPDPNTTMYNDLERPEGGSFTGGEQFKKALARYEFYKNDPDSERTITGKLIYNNKIVPYPEQSMFGDMKVKAPQLVAGGFRNAGVNALELGETVTDLVGITDPETTYIKDNFAKLDPGDSTVDSLLIEGTGLIAGGGVAGKAAKALVGKIDKLKDFKYGNTIKNIAGAIGFDVGVASTAESDAGTLLVGSNSMLENMFGYQPEIFSGVDVDSDDPKAKQEMAKRMNILMDGLTAAGVVGAGVQGTVFVAKTMYNVLFKGWVDMASTGVREEEYVRSILDTLTGVGDDPASIEAARNTIIKLIEDNKDLYVDLPEELADKVQTSVDAMTAVERALKNGNTDEARNIIMKAQALKKGVIQTTQGNNQTAINAARPTEELDRVLTESEGNLGGSKAIDQTNKALQDQGVAEVDEAALNLVKAEDNLANLNETVVRELTEDPSIIGRVTDLEKKTGFDIGSVRENSADEIVANLSRASEEMDAMKNDLFNQIEGGAVDITDLIGKLESLKPQQLDLAASAMPGDDLFGKLLEQTKLQSRVVDGEVVQETAEEMQERFASWALQNDLNFAKLFTEIRPSLVDSINRLEMGSAPEKGAAQTLIKFKKWIDEDAIKLLDEVGDDTVKEAAEEAMDYFKNQWAPFWDDGSTLQQIGSLRRQTVARGKQAPKFQDESRQLVKGAINDDNRSVAANMVKLLDRPEAGESAPLVTDFIIGDVLSTLSTRLDSAEKVSDLGLDAVRQGLSRYSTLIRQNFGQEADRLDALVNRLSDTKLTKEQLQREIVEAKRLADEAKDRIFTKELNGFFTAQGVRNPNGYNTLEKIFNNQQSADRITELLARAEGDPIIEAGIQAAYTRWFRNKFLGTTTSTAGDRTMKLGEQMLNEEGVKNAFEYADIIFKNKPEFVSALDTLLAEAGLVQRSRASKAIPTGSGTAELTEQIANLNRGITTFVGVLSRFGARLRAAGSAMLQQKFNPQSYFNMVDNLMSDPDEFVAVARRVVAKDRETSYGALFEMAMYAGIYREDTDENRADFEQKMQEIELGFEEARSQKEQSQELFGE